MVNYKKQCRKGIECSWLFTNKCKFYHHPSEHFVLVDLLKARSLVVKENCTPEELFHLTGHSYRECGERPIGWCVFGESCKFLPNCWYAHPCEERGHTDVPKVTNKWKRVCEDVVLEKTTTC